MKLIAALLLLVAVVQAADLLHSDSPTRISGSYIVVLKEGSGVARRDAHIEKLKATIAATNDSSEITFIYWDALVGFAAKLSDEMLKIELADADVQYVEADQVVRLVEDVSVDADSTITQTGATWGISRIASQQTWTEKTTYIYDSQAGAGVNAYIIDTGILISHNDFGGRATAGYNAITNEQNTDLNGHGTHCAGTVGGATYGVAKKVNLIAVKVLSASGSGSTSGVIAGINYVTNQYKANTAIPSVASMSLGGGASTSLDNAVISSINAGVSYSIAAGNDGSNACNYSPAKVSQSHPALTVGATQNNDAKAYYSNYGTCVNIFAPGTSITSDWIGTNTAINTISGTSMATPHVTGVIALRLGVAGVQTPNQIQTWIQEMATDGVVTNPGTGSTNKLLYAPHPIVN